MLYNIIGGVTMLRILIVEDEKPIANLITMNLRMEGYNCTTVYDGEEAADMLEKRTFDLVLLDIMLPKINGYELFEYIRPLDIPVIFITAMGGIDEKIHGLRLGADDYIVKPFQVGELTARVEVVLRRMGKKVTEYNVNGVSINTESRTVMRDGRLVELTAKEFDLMLELVRNKNVALYRERLYERVWNEPFRFETRTLDAHIQRLRKKLGWEECIKTVFRIGYRLEVRS